MDKLKEHLPQQVKIQTKEIIKKQKLVSKTEMEVETRKIVDHTIEDTNTKIDEINERVMGVFDAKMDAKIDAMKRKQRRS